MTFDHRVSIENVVTRHTDLFWNVDFDKQCLSGEAILHFNIVAKEIERIVSMRWTLHYDNFPFLDIKWVTFRFLFPSIVRRFYLLVHLKIKFQRFFFLLILFFIMWILFHFHFFFLFSFSTLFKIHFVYVFCRFIFHKKKLVARCQRFDD